MQRRTLFAAALAAPLGSALAQSPWRAATEYPAGSIPAEGLTTFARACAARGGPTIMPLFDAPDGVRSAAMPGAVAAGAFAVGNAFAGALAPLDPLFLLSSLPFLATSIDAAARLRDAARPAYSRALQQLGVTLLWTTPWPASGLWSRRPIADPADLRGLRLRTYDRTGTEVFARAGAAAELLSFAAVAERLAAGTLDAVLSSGDGGAGRRLWEHLPHFTAIGYAMPLSLGFVGPAALHDVPEQTRAAVFEAGAATEAAQWRLILTRGDANLAVMRTNGVQLAEATPALLDTLRTAAAAAAAGWAAQAGPGAAEILAAFRDA